MKTPSNRRGFLEERRRDSHQPVVHADVNFIRISEASSLAEKNVDLGQSRALYNGREQNMCVLGERGGGGQGEVHTLVSCPFSSASAYPRNQRGVLTEYELLFGETTF